MVKLDWMEDSPFIPPWIPSPKAELSLAAAASPSSFEQCTLVLRDSQVREALRDTREPFKHRTALVLATRALGDVAQKAWAGPLHASLRTLIRLPRIHRESVQDL